MSNLNVDALVIGGGIAGMQAALDLADQGYNTAIVEREPSIGGKMITLSKVFPTLDCCSCITTPKMSSVAHHPKIKMLTYCDVQTINENEKGFSISILQNRVTLMKTNAPDAENVNMNARLPSPVLLIATWVHFGQSECPFPLPFHKRRSSIQITAYGAENAKRFARLMRLITTSSPK